MPGVLLTTNELGDVVLATSPKVAGATVVMTALFGTDGVDVGSDADSDDLEFPVPMDEGAPGIYSTRVMIRSSGLYFAEFTVDGAVYGPVVVRVTEDGSARHLAGSECVVGIVATSAPVSVQVTITDREGTNAGEDSSGTAISWPVAATVVDGHPKCWYIDDLYFSTGGKYHIAMHGPSGPVWNDSISIRQLPQGTAGAFDGWIPDEAYSPADWIGLAYIRRLIGWPKSIVDDIAVRELRAMAVETFIDRTGMWVAPWTGTWTGLRAQGERLYLPVPVLLAQDGAEADPVVVVTNRNGSKEEVETLSADDLIWRLRGQHARQPYVQINQRGWNPENDVSITGTFGLVANMRQVPLKVQQCLLGLIRWHSLSYGQGPDRARDQATLNRITDESSRDRSVTYDQSAVSNGLTGDPVIDRILAEYTINAGPVARRNGESCDRGW